jgi:hypothetical protein
VATKMGATQTEFWLRIWLGCSQQVRTLSIKLLPSAPTRAFTEKFWMALAI